MWVVRLVHAAAGHLILQWDYSDTYSTYTKVEWRIMNGATSVASGSIPRSDPITAAVSSPLTATIPLKDSQNLNLQGRFTVEVAMGNGLGTSAWSPPSAEFATGVSRMTPGGWCPAQLRRK